MRVRRDAAAFVMAAFLLGSAAVAGCGGEGPVQAQGDPVRGAQIVDVDDSQVEPNCGLCHFLAAAGFEGTTAPNLDALQPGYQRVLEAISEGPGAMPSFEDQLDSGQLRDVAAYISGAAAESRGGG